MACCRLNPHWGWMVVLACFCVRIFVYGMTTTSGILYIIFLEEFHESKGATALIGSLITASGYFTGALAGSLVNRYGPRIVVIIAGAIASSGLVASMFASSVLHLIISYGVVSGIGFGLCYVPMSVAVVEYFDTHRNVAMAFATCGGGMGRFVFPVFLRWLIDLFGWRGTLLICGGLSLNIIVFGALMRPSEEEIVKEECSSKIITSKSANTSLGCSSKLLGSKSTSAGLGSANSSPQLKNKGFLPKGMHQFTLAMSDTSIAMSQNLYFASQSELSGDSLSGGLKRPNSSTSNSKTIKCKFSQRNQTVFHWDIFKNPKYCILCLNNFLYFIGLSIVYVHLSAYAKIAVGIDENRSALLFTVVGGINLLGKLFLGSMTQHPKIKEIVVYIICIVTFGVATLLLPIAPSYPILMVYACVFGVCDSTLGGAILPALLVHYAGKEKMSSSYGAVLVMEGVGHFIGAPIAGYLFEKTLMYSASFYLGGATILISGLIMIIPWKLMKQCDNPAEDVVDDEDTMDEIGDIKRQLKEEITEDVVTTV
ncbi:monocarboxylate transporter 12-like [Lineus longissimus]|uniref:monocarboxylate transporter 12-like n=1 Tax=Lineus longissimus TaxID=88925 RepID=UPI002B4C4B3A